MSTDNARVYELVVGHGDDQFPARRVFVMRKGQMMTQPIRAALMMLRRKQVEAESGYSRSTIYLRISQGLWPRPVKLGARSVGWPAGEVESLNAARVAGASDDSIRALVAGIHEKRKAVMPRAA